MHMFMGQFFKRNLFLRFRCLKTNFNWCRDDLSNIKDFDFRFLSITFFVLQISFFEKFLKMGELCPKNKNFTTKSLIYKNLKESKIVMHTRFLLLELGNLSNLRTKKGMDKKRKSISSIFDKSSLHQWKINLKYSYLENRILLEKLAQGHVHCAHTVQKLIF